jgi:hypothetical protein
VLQTSSGYKPTVTGMKNQGKQTTQTSLVFTWTISEKYKHTSVGTKASGKHLDTIHIGIDIYGPRSIGQTADNVNNRVASFDLSLYGEGWLKEPHSTPIFSSYVWVGAANGGIQVIIRRTETRIEKENSDIYNDMYTIEITGLQAGAKYTMYMQAEGYPENGGTGFSKVTKVSATTNKYLAPKIVPGTAGKPIVGSNWAELSWQENYNSGVSGAKTYEVGIFVGNVCLFGDDLGEYMTAKGITFDPALTGKQKWIKVAGLKPQKYTFGIREIGIVGGFEVKSAILKIGVKLT